MRNIKLIDKIDDIIEMIIEGFSFRIMAQKLEVPLATLHDYTSTPEHSARVQEALRYSAQTFDDKAEQVLINATGTMPEIQRARELAQHYRWRSSKRYPAKFGDKLDVTSGGEPIKKQVFKIGDTIIEL